MLPKLSILIICIFPMPFILCLPASSQPADVIWVKLHEPLNLLCPIFSRSIEKSSPGFESWAMNGPVIYNWEINDLFEYQISSNERYSFSERVRRLNIQSVDSSDQGVYTCNGITGHEKKSFTFRINVIDPKSPLKCAGPNGNEICFANSDKEKYPQVTIKKEIGDSIKMECEAFGPEPLTYTWKKGENLANWADVNGNARLPYLTIDPIKPDHQGRYTCYVKSAKLPKYTLQYNYEVIVEDPTFYYPEIITKMENRTLESQHSVSISARVKCSCTNPIIRWVKRIDSDEQLAAYKKFLGPKPKYFRLTDTNENFETKSDEQDNFILIENSYAPIFVEMTKMISPNVPEATVDKWTSSGWSSEIEASRIFITTIRLIEPLSPLLHAGRYMIIVSNVHSDPKSLHYESFDIQIAQEPWSSSTKGVVIYFLIPFGLLCCLVILTVYCVLCKRRKGDLGRAFMRSRQIDDPMVPFDSSYSKMKKLGSHNINFQQQLFNQQQPPKFGKSSPPKWGDTSYSGGSNPSQNTLTTMSRVEAPHSMVTPLPPPPNYPPPPTNSASLFPAVVYSNASSGSTDISSMYDQNLYTSVGIEDSYTLNGSTRDQHYTIPSVKLKLNSVVN